MFLWSWLRCRGSWLRLTIDSVSLPWKIRKERIRLVNLAKSVWEIQKYSLSISHTHTCSCTKGKEKNISCWHCCPFFSLNSQNAARETSSHDPFTWYKISTLLASMKMSFNICCISPLYQHSTSSSSNPLSFTAQESVNATKYTLLHYSSNQIKIWNIMVGVSFPPISSHLPQSPS